MACYKKQRSKNAPLPIARYSFSLSNLSVTWVTVRLGSGGITENQKKLQFFWWNPCVMPLKVQFNKCAFKSVISIGTKQKKNSQSGCFLFCVRYRKAISTGSVVNDSLGRSEPVRAEPDRAAASRENSNPFSNLSLLHMCFCFAWVRVWTIVDWVMKTKGY